MNYKTFKPLQTERLTLRQLKSTDDEAIFSLRSDETVAHYVARPVQKNIAAAQSFIDKIITGIQNDKWLYWAIISKEDNVFLGTICLWQFSEDRKTAEVGYELLPQSQGKGIMDEALKSVIEFAFATLKLTTIEAFTHKENTASLQLLIKNKFVHHPERIDEGFPNNSIYVLTVTN